MLNYKLSESPNTEDTINLSLAFQHNTADKQNVYLYFTCVFRCVCMQISLLRWHLSKYTKHILCIMSIEFITLKFTAEINCTHARLS